MRALHGHHQGHEEGRRPLPGRARESARTAAAGAGERDREGRGRGGKEKSPPGLGRFNVAPTQELLVVRASPEPEEAEQGEREARLMRWGLVPVWAKDLKVGYRMINAKTENLMKSRAYGPLVGKYRHRCLIVADGFYEWMKAEDPKQPRQPWRFQVDGGEPFAFAGLCTRKEWADPEERGYDDGYLYTCTLVTTTPNEVVAPVHNRMPAILPEPRGRGGLAAARAQRRGRGRDVRAAGRGPDVERPGQPGAEQGRQRDGGRAGAAGGAAGAAATSSPRRLRFFFSSASSRSSAFSSSASSSIGGERSVGRPAVVTVALPALVSSVQPICAEGTSVVRQIVKKGSSRSFFGLPAMKYLIRSSPTTYSGHSTLTPCSVVKRRGRSGTSSEASSLLWELKSISTVSGTSWL